MRYPALVLLASGLLWTLALPAQQAQPPEGDLARTRLGLYATAVEAWELLQTDPSAVLVDVRDPVEAMFTGFAKPTRVHVPWVLVDPTRFDAANQRYQLQPNKRFDEEILARLKALGVAREAPILVICRSGATRSAPAADRLHELGFTRVYSITDGFEGERLREGPSAGVRLLGGWRNSGLPWSYALPEEVAYRVPEGSRD